MRSVTSTSAFAAFASIAMATAGSAGVSEESAPQAPIVAVTTQSGGAATVNVSGQKAYAMPLANIGMENRRAFSVGNSFFNENWVAAPASPAARDGLGPLFNARSCSSCHLFDGRGAPPEPGQLMTALLFRLSVPGTDDHGGPRPVDGYGGQLQPRALPGLDPEGDVEITFTQITDKFPDGTVYVLQRPQYHPRDWHGGPVPPNLRLGPRIANAVFGGGLLEAVPESDILAWADVDDADKNGISGRPNRVWDSARGAKALGRFGWKANQPTLRQQAADAFNGDMGLTSSLRPEENMTPSQKEAASRYPSGGEAGGPEVTDKVLDRVETYLRCLAPPARRDIYESHVRRGQQLFHALRCAECHRAEVKTGTDDWILPELRGQTIAPYTDLLLHDMGPDLADDRPDYDASGSEWRTAPLWGIGLQKTVNGHTRLLHDGRAANAEEAILWHGGEAAPIRDAYKALARPDREAVLRFLDSL